jgi:hypothetical protein
MSSFFDFVTNAAGSADKLIKQAKSDISTVVAKDLQRVEALAITPVLASDASKIAVEFGQIAYSSAFLQKLSDAIGAPSIHETEDEFLARSKNRLAELLSIELNRAKDK